MSHQRLFSVITVFLLPILSACPDRPTKPLVLTEQVGELPVQFSSQNCNIPILPAPPTESYEVIARVKPYGNPGTDQAEMNDALHREACAIGAHAVIVQKMKEGEFADEILMTHMGYSTMRDYTSTAEYAYHAVTLVNKFPP